MASHGGRVILGYKGRDAVINKDGQLHVFLGNTDPEEGCVNEIKYVVVGAGATETIWAPASGKSIHLDALIVSMEGVGSVDIKFATDIKTHLEFSEKNAVPLPIIYPICLGADVPLNATATGDIAHVSALGFEIEV